MACHLFGAKPLPEPVLTVYQLDLLEQIAMKFGLEYISFENVAGKWPHFIYTLILDAIYRKVSYIRRTIVGNKIVDHSDVVGASPVGAAPTTSSFST